MLGRAHRVSGKVVLLGPRVKVGDGGDGSGGGVFHACSPMLSLGHWCFGLAVAAVVAVVPVSARWSN